MAGGARSSASSKRTTPRRIPGLRYVTDAEPGLRRRRSGRGFVYLRPGGRRVRSRAELERIKRLAIPPAWTQVWICPHPNGHLQATGRDAKGRKQYRYHPRWREVRDGAKFDSLIPFGAALPTLRRRVRKDMARTGMPKERVVATVVALLDCCFARIGNDRYTRANGSFGLTTLRDRHAGFDGGVLRLRYRGKGGKEHEAHIDDPRIVHIVRRSQAIPGQTLFQYRTDDGAYAPVTSTDVNAYLQEVTGDAFTAKDFRTWAATVSAAEELGRQDVPSSESEGQRLVLEAVDAVAEQLGNTRAVCRSSYIHPEIEAGFLDGSLSRAFSSGAPRVDGLRAAERIVLRFLRRRRGAARAA